MGTGAWGADFQDNEDNAAVPAARKTHLAWALLAVVVAALLP